MKNSKPTNSTKTHDVILMWAIVIVVVLAILVIGIRNAKDPIPVSPKQVRQEQIAEQFSSWDGSHPNLTKYIMKSMHDPDSYEHVETRYEDKGDYLIVATKFRGTNAFGGKITQIVVAECSLKGEVLKINQ